MAKRPSDIDRLMAKVAIDAVTGCWNWRAAIGSNGYSQFRLGRMTSGHRASYQLLVGPIPEGLHIDHLCRNRRCVNPDHLEAVTPRENLMRAPTLQAANAAKTHCPKGHPYSGENVVFRKDGTGRYCRTCKYESGARRNARLKVERARRATRSAATS